MTSRPPTLHRHLLDVAPTWGERGASLAALLGQVAYAGKVLAAELARAALAGRTGLAGGANATGDAQKKLDVLSNELVLDAVVGAGLVRTFLSEEADEIVTSPCCPDAPFVLVTDPLDGSSNTDNAGSVGTIFGVYPAAADEGEQATLSRLAGRPPLLAGYVLYGTSTVLVYTTGHGVHGFTLDREHGEFRLSHEGLRIPARGRTVSANLARVSEWPAALAAHVARAFSRDVPSRRPYGSRYAGALVADLHRCLLEGGVYLYPPDADHPRGKLRRVYECAPLAFVVEAAGGRASDGARRILDGAAASLHERTPFYVGSALDVADVEASLQPQPAAV